MNAAAQDSEPREPNDTRGLKPLQTADAAVPPAPAAAEVLAFLLQLAVSLLATGDAVSDIESRLLDD